MVLSGLGERLVCSFCETENSSFNPCCKHCGKDLPLPSFVTGLVPEPPSTSLKENVATVLHPDIASNYIIQQHLGAQPWSGVYAAQCRSSGRKVALKIFDAAGKDPRDWQRMWRVEARALQKLNHPHIAQILAIHSCQEMAVLVLEWVEGGTFTPLPGDATLPEMARQAVDALAFAHGLGLVHRDLKPQHFLQTLEGNLKIIDFGLVKRVDPSPDSLPSTPSHLRWKGTPIYMAPEQIHGQPLDWRCDQSNGLGKVTPSAIPIPR